ncbi:hypothetical protein FRC06_001552 [Ceratobasidium sp. 370]|nr:hypothetical protein FRC06_001552 [Ceratobasidium sp. 370]
MANRPRLSSSELAQPGNIEKFEDWSTTVGVRPDSERSGAPLPDELKEIIKLSRTFPTWFQGDADSLPYSSLDPLLSQFTKTFHDLSNTEHYIADNATNKSLKEILPAILRSCWRMTKYSVFAVVAEVDFRTVVDVIILDAIWPLQAGHSESILVTMEPKLSLPKARGSVVRCTSATLDSAFCINAGRALLSKCSPAIQRDFNSFDNPPGIKSLLLPHLLIEYKNPAKADPTALRQVKIAMVSALYQRYALRHPDHFVFGICQTSTTYVHVIAARWALKATAPRTGNRSLRDTGMTGDRAHGSTSKETLEASRQPEAALKIEFYYLDELNLELPIDLVRLYLVVLATVPLAMTYRDQLLQNPPTAPAPDFDDWADDQTRGSKSETTQTGSTGNKHARFTGPGDDEPGGKLGDIQRLPEMSSHYKCLRYVESLPSL